MDVVLILIGLLTLLFAPDYLAPRKLPLAEFTATLLFAISGGMLIAGGQDLLILFLGLELLVLPGYLLAGFAKRDGLSTEGAIKYFLLGSFSSAILLFGLAFVLGFTGTTQLDGHRGRSCGASSTAAQPLPLALAMGLGLLAVGVLFKIAAVPFHYWTPDAYQGSPTPVTGYLSVGPQDRRLRAHPAPLRGGPDAAARRVGAGHRRAGGRDHDASATWPPWARTTSSACWPTRRSPTPATSWSGLVVFATAPTEAVAEAGVQSVLFYGVAYAFMNLGAFAVVAALQRRPGVTSQIATFTGLGYRAPVLALTMTVFLLSLTGIPPLAGFFAKALVVLGALEVGGGTSLLAVILMLNAAAAAFYYLRVVVVMYMRKPAEDAARSASACPRASGSCWQPRFDHRHRPGPAGHAGRAGLDGGRGRGPHLDLGPTPGLGRPGPGHESQEAGDLAWRGQRRDRPARRRGHGCRHDRPRRWPAPRPSRASAPGAGHRRPGRRCDRRRA